MTAPRTVLVTGASGMIGTALCERLLDEGHRVIGVDRRANRWAPRVDERTIIADLCDESAYEGLPTEVDAVVHLAAHSRVRALVKRPRLARKNVESTLSVLEYARRRNVDDVIFASSREVYGGGESGQKDTFDEDDLGIDACGNPYAASKVSGESFCRAYGRCFGVSPCILRFANVYGRYDLSDRAVPSFVSRALRGRELLVYGGGKWLDFFHLDDCVDGIVRALDAHPDVRGEVFNVGSGRGTTVIELAEEVVRQADSDSDVRVTPGRAGETDRSVLDVSKSERRLGYRPSRSLSEGIAETVQWYRDAGVADEVG